MPNARLLVVAVTCALFAAGHTADARAERLALVGSDAELEGACVHALGTWDVTVVPVTEEPPGTELPRAAERARSLARTHGARAVVWIAPASPEGPGLWLYDVSQGRVVVVRLSSGPPFDAPTAAAVALSIKTLLRYSEVAPPDERLAVPPPRPTRFALEGRVGARMRPDPAPALEPRFGVTALFRPLRGRLAVALGLRAGPGYDLERDDFVGSYGNTAISLAARVGLPIGPRLGLVPSLGASLQLDSVSGTAVSRAESASDQHVNPAVDAGVALEARLGRDLRVSLVVETGYRLRRQRFLVGSDEVLDLPAAEGEVALSIAVPTF